MFGSSKVDRRAISQETHEGRHPDMLRPRGRWVGVSDTTEDAATAREKRPPPSNESSGDADWVEDVLEDICAEYAEPADGEPQGAQTQTSEPDAKAGPTRIKLPKIFDHPDFPNKGISVDQALKLARGAGDKKARERCARVMSRTMAGTKAAAEEELKEEARLLARVDPLVVLVRGAKGVSAVLAEPIAFKSDAQTMDEIAASELPTVTITVNVLRPRAHLVQGSLVYANSSTGGTIEVEGRAATPISPEIHHRDGGSVEWRVGRDILQLVAELRWSDLSKDAAARLSVVQNEACLLPGAASDGRGTKGVIYMDGSATLEEQQRADRAKTGDSVKCELCKTEVKKSDMRQHMGQHILLTDDTEWLRKYKTVKPDFPCGLCGKRCAVGQELQDDSVDMCFVSVAKARSGKSTAADRPVHKCKLVGELEYDLKPAAKVTTTTPCTNRSIMCSICGFGLWTYSLKTHFQKEHASDPIPEAMRAAMTLGTHEREWMVIKGTGKRPKACALASCQCKKE